MALDKEEITPGQLVQVIWEDTHIEGTWLAPEDAEKCAALEVSTVGHFVGQDRDAVRVAFQYNPKSGLFDEVAAIPIGTVISINLLEMKL